MEELNLKLKICNQSVKPFTNIICFINIIVYSLTLKKDKTGAFFCAAPAAYAPAYAASLQASCVAGIKASKASKASKTSKQASSS